MLYFILLPFFCTGIAYLVDSLFKREHKLSTYIIFFMMYSMCQVVYFTLSKLYGDEFIDQRIELYSDFSSYSQTRISEELSFLDIDMLTSKQKVDFKRKIAYHKKEGARCFNEAKDYCKLVPNVAERNKAFGLFSSTLLASAGALMNGYVGVIQSLLGDLALWAANYQYEWTEMRTLLKTSKYHYEMCVFYQDGLDNDIDF